MSSSTKCGVITRRSARNSEKCGRKFSEIINEMREHMKVANGKNINRDERTTSINGLYVLLCELLHLCRNHSVCLVTAKATIKATKRMFLISFNRIPDLVEEMITNNRKYPVGYYNKTMAIMERYKQLYIATKNSDTYKAVLFSRVKVPNDIFRLIMEYYIVWNEPVFK